MTPRKQNNVTTISFVLLSYSWMSVDTSLLEWKRSKTETLGVCVFFSIEFLSQSKHWPLLFAHCLSSPPTPSRLCEYNLWIYLFVGFRRVTWKEGVIAFSTGILMFAEGKSFMWTIRKVSDIFLLSQVSFILLIFISRYVSVSSCQVKKSVMDQMHSFAMD